MAPHEDQLRRRLRRAATLAWLTLGLAAGAFCVGIVAAMILGAITGSPVVVLIMGFGAVAGPAIMIAHASRRWRGAERALRQAGVRGCARCGYNLAGLPDAGVCPECGWRTSGPSGG